ncbi:MAG: ATP-dependent DNA helicase RecG [Acidiferrobacterales bacterium]
MRIASLPVTTLRGVGPKLAQKLARLKLHTVQDVLFHLPYRYQDRTRLTALGTLKPGTEALVAGEIALTDITYRGRRSLVCRITDGTGFINLRFFHFSGAQQRNLQCGRTVVVYGDVRVGPTGFEMTHPEYSVCEDGQTPEPEGCLTPVYPSTEGVHQLTLRRLAQQALDRYLATIDESLPPDVLGQFELPDIRDALVSLHRPPSTDDAHALEQGAHPGRDRLAFEELLAYQLSLRRLRAEQREHDAPAISKGNVILNQLVSQLPYSLTRAQQRVICEIQRDLSQTHPMQRLLQGDVGSGKTVVAIAASACAVEAGLQVAIMAPTEILAEQHLHNVRQWLSPLGIEVVSLLGKIDGRRRREALDVIGSRAAVIVGTHALFQESVEFAALGLVIVDEQHRFGVHQRLALREKGARANRRPHQLIMTATPIPRTLAQTVYADLDVSIIDELPPGRQPVETVVVSGSRRTEVVERIRAACVKGQQAYWVCPLIDESDHVALQTVTDTEARLHTALPELEVSLVHGRLKLPVKDHIMAAFREGTVNVLVATTVIEVGVDVPNASLMVIENAERLGLSQLHQLRGRIGRGARRSTCVLMYQPPLSPQARERLAVLRSSTDGFEIARKDLEMRGPGEILGTRQTGLEQFRVADLVRDHRKLPTVQQLATILLRDYPNCADAIIDRWRTSEADYTQV